MFMFTHACMPVFVCDSLNLLTLEVKNYISKVIVTGNRSLIKDWSSQYIRIQRNYLISFNLIEKSVNVVVRPISTCL